MPAGYLVHKNAFVLNARYATDAAKEDSDRAQNPKRARHGYSTVYPGPAAPADRGIQRGELLWDRVPNKYAGPRLSGDQQPYVRAALNGVAVDAGKKIADEIRVLGVARKSVAYDAKKPGADPSDDPVVVVAGHETVFNTGEGPIRPGDALEWYVVSDSHRHQIRDGVTMFSPTRMSLGLRPLTVKCTVKEMCKDPVFNAHWTAFFENTKLASEFPGLQFDHPAFDILLSAIVEEIADAYQWCSGVATQNAPSGTRFDEMFTPFMKIGVEKVAEAPAAPAPTGGGAPPPPPLNPAERLKSYRFETNFFDPSTYADDLVLYDVVAAGGTKIVARKVVKLTPAEHKTAVQELFRVFQRQMANKSTIIAKSSANVFDLGMWKIVSAFQVTPGLLDATERAVVDAFKGDVYATMADAAAALPAA